MRQDEELLNNKITHQRQEPLRSCRRCVIVGIKGDIIADLNEDLAAEQKARVTYDNILRLCDDPDVRDPIKYLRQREIVHYQRFGDAKQSG